MPFSTSGRRRALRCRAPRPRRFRVDAGAVAVRFIHEPDYFLGTSIMGDPCDVLIARERLDGA